MAFKEPIFMSRFFEVTFDAAQVPGPLEGQGPAMSFPTTTLQVELNPGGTWRLVHTQLIPRHCHYLYGQYPYGKYIERGTGYFELYNNDRTRQVMQLDPLGDGKARALGLLSRKTGMFALRGRWSGSSAALPNTWAGLVFKGSANLGFGYDGNVGMVFSLFNGDNCMFLINNGRVGLVAGAAVGFAFAIGTGFRTEQDFAAYSNSGWDGALTLGIKAKAVVTGSATLKNAFKVFQNGVKKAEDVMKLAHNSELTKEVHGLAKSALVGTMVDTEVANITLIDIPIVLSGGAEVGVFYAWSSLKVLRYGRA